MATGVENNKYMRQMFIGKSQHVDHHLHLPGILRIQRSSLHFQAVVPRALHRPKNPGTVRNRGKNIFVRIPEAAVGDTDLELVSPLLAQNNKK